MRRKFVSGSEMSSANFPIYEGENMISLCFQIQVILYLNMKVEKESVRVWWEGNYKAIIYTLLRKRDFVLKC